MITAPVLGEAAPEFARIVEAALRERGADDLADQVGDLRVVSFCNCAPLCGAFLSVPHHERSKGKLTTDLVVNSEAMIVLVETMGDLIVGLDVLDSGELRTVIDRFVKPS